MKSCVTYDKSSEAGMLIISVPFERGLSKEAYEGRMKYILGQGGTEQEARTYAGHLDYPKPVAAIAEMNTIAPNSGIDWQKLVADAIKGEA